MRVLKVVLTVAAFSFFPVPDARGYNAGPLVFDNIDSRSSAMGGPMIALDNRVNDVFINPAGLGLLRKQGMTVTHSFEFMGISNSFIGIAMPLGKYGIGAGWNRKFTDIETTDETNRGESVRYSNNNVVLALAYTGFHPMLVGTDFRYIHKHFARFRMSGVTLDTGFKVSITKNFTIAYAVKNLFFKRLKGRSYWNDNTVEETLDTVLAVGIFKSGNYFLRLPERAGYNRVSSTGTVTGRGEQGGVFKKMNIRTGIGFDIKTFIRDFLTASFIIGGEVVVERSLGIRLGWESVQGISAGLSVYYKRLKIDYAFLPGKYLGSTHKVSLTF